MPRNRLSLSVRAALARIPKPLLAVEAARSDHIALSRQDWFAVIGAALAAFLAVLDIQITNASLREIQGDLNLDLSESGWVSTAYLVAEVAVIPLVTALAAVFGLRRSFGFSSIAFVASSLLCGFSWDLSSMALLRAIQGLCGGALIPLAFQTLLITMPANKRNLGLAIFGLTATLAPTLGPSLGGYLTETWGWRFAFWLNILPGVAMTQLLFRGLRPEPLRIERLKQVDFVSALCLGSFLGAMTFCLEEGPKHDWLQSGTVRNVGLLGLMGIAIFVWRAVWLGKRLIAFSLLKRRNFGIAVAMTTLGASALYGGIYALSLYLGQVQGYGAIAIGDVLMWVGIPQLFVMPFLPFLMSRVDARYLIFFGLSLFTWSVWINTGMDSNYAGAQFRWVLMIRAIGQPLFLIPLSAVGMSDIRPQESAQASALFNMFRNLGGSIGISLVNTNLTHFQAHFSRTVLNRIAVGDWRVPERLMQLKFFFLSQTQDLATAEAQSLRTLNQLVNREAAVLSFSSVFGGMAVGLVVCLMLTFLIRPTAIRPGGGIDAH